MRKGIASRRSRWLPWPCITSAIRATSRLWRQRSRRLGRVDDRGHRLQDRHGDRPVRHGITKVLRAIQGVVAAGDTLYGFQMLR